MNSDLEHAGNLSSACFRNQNRTAKGVRAVSRHVLRPEAVGGVGSKGESGVTVYSAVIFEKFNPDVLCRCIRILIDGRVP